MAKQSINTLKNWYLTTLKPTQQQFWDWLDSYRHKDDKVLASDVEGLQTLLDTKVDKKDIASPEVWNPAEPYVYDADLQQYVSYVNAGSENPQFNTEGFYRLLANTVAGESPETHPAKWAYQGQTIGEIAINDVLGLTEALAGKIASTEKAAANGVATLGSDGLLLASQRPPGTADENVKVGAAGVGDYLNDAYFNRSTDNHIRPKIAQGKIWQGDADGIGQPVDPPTGGSSKWTALVATTDFATTAASTSTITMANDKSALIMPGMALKFTLSGIVYYAICTAITANLLTIAGASLTTTAGALTALSYCDMPDSVYVEIVAINGAFADNSTTTLIESDLLLKGGIVWKKSKAFCVQMGIICTNLDSGTVTTEAQLNAKINSLDLLSTDLTIATTLQNSVIQINTSNYDINYNEPIELELAALATGTPNHDALNLTAYLIFIFP